MRGRTPLKVPASRPCNCMVHGTSDEFGVSWRCESVSVTVRRRLDEMRLL